MDKDYYKILGVPRDASQDDIKKAFHSVSITTVQLISRRFEPLLQFTVFFKMTMQ
jgi:hypothetical protein